MAENYLGESMPKLGFGYMRLPKTESDEFDYELINEMVDKFIGSGFSYFDTAHMYSGSEETMKKTLVERYPREKFHIATKLPIAVIPSSDDMQRYFDESLSRTGAGYFDFYLIHSMSATLAEKAEKFGAWEFISKMKEKGLVRHIGFSYHGTADVLDGILTRHPEAEFVQLQINYVDWESEAVQSRLCYEVARKHNKPVTIMEPAKGGALANPPDETVDLFKKANPSASCASWALRFAASHDGLIAVLSGMNSVEQMIDNIETFKNFKPISSDELEVLGKAVDIYKNIPRIPCTECRYCVDGCPQNIKIPELIKIYNEYLVYKTLALGQFRYIMSTSDNNKASSCVQCKACEEHCPQNIEITDTLCKIAAIYE